jgi:8-amino-7-oxononanoate synthase
MKDLAVALARQHARHLYRSRQILEGPQGTEIEVGGREYLSFCSNDYLGLANHPAVVAALQEGAARYGVGSGASHLITGHSRAHHQLEETLAEFTGRPRALLFSTGYMANLAALSTLAGRHDTVYADRLNHASLVDGIRLAGARLRRYRHSDTTHLASLLADKSRDEPSLIVSDGVFSMDGDCAPVAELAGLARDHGARLMIDDAHGLGVTGKGGGGTLAQLALTVEDVPLLVGTLGKAFGTFGAFIAGGEELIETMIQRARPYIYTTALPPAIAHATITAVSLARREEWRREKLRALGRYLVQGARRIGIDLPDTVPIVPLVIGDASRAIKLSDGLRARGILISAIRPPTVPASTARLRITLSATHSETDIDGLLSALSEVM